jgi:hypothetical protein
MGVGQTSWAVNTSNPKNETYVVSKLFTPKKHENKGSGRRSPKSYTGSDTRDNTEGESIPVNKNTFGLVGL